MKIFRVVAALVLTLVGSAAFAQSCSSAATALPDMGPPGFAAFSNSFNSAGDYTDCYTFDLSGSASSFGGAIELNRLFNSLELDLKSVSLYNGGTLVGYDDSPLFFSFGALAGGMSYTLAIAASVTESFGLFDKPVGYAGVFTTYAAPVPEPASVAMLLIGLLGVGWAVRRKLN